MSNVVDIWARLQEFRFPGSFLWYWKLEILRERYEPEVTMLLKKRMTAGMVAIDVGANIGYFTRLMARLVGPQGRVYAFEPDQENRTYAVENTTRYPWVEVLGDAVSQEVGSIDFYHVLGMTGTHTTLPTAGAERRTVNATTIDAFVRARGLSRVDVLKIDVEGAEPDVFAGMEETLARFKPLVVFEYTPSSTAAFLESLRQRHVVYALSPAGELLPFEDATFRVGKQAYTNLVLLD